MNKPLKALCNKDALVTNIIIRIGSSYVISKNDKVQWKG